MEDVGLIDLFIVSYNSINKQKQYKEPSCKKETNWDKRFRQVWAFRYNIFTKNGWGDYVQKNQQEKLQIQIKAPV